MRRWHEDQAVTRREWRRHHRRHVEANLQRTQGDRPWELPPGADPREVDCPCDTQEGRFRKRRGRGCRKARCRLCHGYKFPKREPTRKERQADQVFQEQLRERRDQADRRTA